MRWTRLTLVITEAFVALSAFGAGAMLVVAPSGRLMGMTEATLARSPFRSYLVPGIVLFAVVGGTQALAAWAEIRRWPRAGWLSVRCEPCPQLDEMARACRRIADCTKGLDFAAFSADKNTQDAVRLAMPNIGHASIGQSPRSRANLAAIGHHIQAIRGI